MVLCANNAIFGKTIGCFFEKSSVLFFLMIFGKYQKRRSKNIEKMKYLIDLFKIKLFAFAFHTNSIFKEGNPGGGPIKLSSML